MKLMNLDQEHLGIQETEYEVVIKKSVGDLVGTKLPAAGNIIVSTEGDSGQYQDATCLPMPSRVGGHQNMLSELDGFATSILKFNACLVEKLKVLYGTINVVRWKPT